MDDCNQPRVLCPDESCIGTIGTDGRCRVCGERFVEETVPVESDTGGAADVAPSRETAAPEIGTTGACGADDETDSDPGQAPADSDWEARALCPDESCIGVIGADGRCGVCGRAADPPVS